MQITYNHTIRVSIWTKPEVKTHCLTHRFRPYGLLARYVKVWVCTCAGNVGNVFFRHRLQRRPPISDPGMHHGTCVTHVPWCMSGSPTCDGGGKRSRHSRHMRNPQFYVSGKRPIPRPVTSKIHNMYTGTKGAIRTFGNRCLSAIGGGNRWSRFAGWVQLSAEAAWPPRRTASATLCVQATMRLMIMIYNAGNLHK